MQNITIERNTNINSEALDAAIRAAVGGKISGISTGSYGVCIHLTDETTTAADIEQARSIVTAHDPAILTADQQARQDRTQALATARSAQATPINVAAYKSEKAIIKALAGKIAWLEQEIVELRGESPEAEAVRLG